MSGEVTEDDDVGAGRLSHRCTEVLLMRSRRAASEMLPPHSTTTRVMRSHSTSARVGVSTSGRLNQDRATLKVDVKLVGRDRFDAVVHARLLKDTSNPTECGIDQNLELAYDQ